MTLAYDLTLIYCAVLIFFAAIKVLRLSESDVPDVLCADDMFVSFMVVVFAFLPAAFGAREYTIYMVLATISILWLESVVFACFGVSPDLLSLVDRR